VHVDQNVINRLTEAIVDPVAIIFEKRVADAFFNCILIEQRLITEKLAQFNNTRESPTMLTCVDFSR